MVTRSLRPELARRLVWEAEVITAQFPGRFRLVRDEHDQAAWDGLVPAEDREFPVLVSYPAAYPAVPPRLATTAALAAGCPHVLERWGERSVLCWLAPGARSPRRRWQPQRHTAATVLRAAQRWFVAYLVWRTLGAWPVADAFSLDERGGP
jgi:hypothetical protein